MNISQSRKINRNQAENTQHPTIDDEVIPVQLQGLLTPGITAQGKDNSHRYKVIPWERRNNIPHIFSNPILINWGWAIAFFVISVFNGWMLKSSSVPLALVIYFAIFPLGTSVYIFSRTTKTLVISQMISQVILAWAICSLEANSSIIPVVFYSINLLFFTFILASVAKESGAVISVLILCSTLVLLITFGWEWIGKIVWYCNLTFTANKAEKKMRNFIDNFDSIMLVLCGIAALGLAVGWEFARISL